MMVHRCQLGRRQQGWRVMGMLKGLLMDKVVEAFLLLTLLHQLLQPLDNLLAFLDQQHQCKKPLLLSGMHIVLSCHDFLVWPVVDLTLWIAVGCVDLWLCLFAWLGLEHVVFFVDGMRWPVQERQEAWCLWQVWPPVTCFGPCLICHWDLLAVVIVNPLAKHVCYSRCFLVMSGFVDMSIVWAQVSLWMPGRTKKSVTWLDARVSSEHHNI